MTISNSRRKLIDHYPVVGHMKRILRNKRVTPTARALGVGQATLSQMKIGAGCQLQTFIRVARGLGYELVLEKRGD